jgi:hypothetical protein
MDAIRTAIVAFFLIILLVLAILFGFIPLSML